MVEPIGEDSENKERDLDFELIKGRYDNEIDVPAEILTKIRCTAGVLREKYVECYSHYCNLLNQILESFMIHKSRSPLFKSKFR